MYVSRGIIICNSFSTLSSKSRQLRLLIKMHLPAAIDFLLCSFDTDTDTFDAPLTLLSLSVHLTEAVSSG